MKGEHKRIVEMGNGWEGSDAVVTLSPGDAEILKAVGAPVEGGDKPNKPHTIKGKDLYAAAQRVAEQEPKTPEGAEPTPNQQSVTGPGTDPGPKGPAASPPNPDRGENEPTGPDPADKPAAPGLVIPAAADSPVRPVAGPKPPADPKHKK